MNERHRDGHRWRLDVSELSRNAKNDLVASCMMLYLKKNEFPHSDCTVRCYPGLDSSSMKQLKGADGPVASVNR